MLRNQIKLIWRGLLKNKMTSLINLSGLTIGLTAVLLIGLFVSNEWVTDRALPEPERTFRLLRMSNINNDPYDIGITSAPFSSALREDFPDAISETVRVLPGTAAIRINERLFQEDNYYYVDSNFLDFFGFKLLVGDSKSALSEVHSVVLTYETATKYFINPEEALGKFMKIDDSYEVQITGVLDKINTPNHFKFSLLESTHELMQAEWWESWWNNNLCTYVRLADQVRPQQLEAAFPKFMDKYFGDDFTTNGTRIDLRLQPLRSIYFEKDIRYDPMRHGDLDALKIFGLAALFLLFVAAANYINLATAQATRKAKEIGVLKTLGSTKRNIITYSLLESSVLVTLSVFLAFEINSIGLPFFEQLFGVDIKIHLDQGLILVILLGATLLMTFLSGFYPGFYLSGFKPVSVLKSGFTPSDDSSGKLRRGMVVIQYVLSTLLLLSTFMIYQQLSYLQSKDLGFGKDHVLLMEINNPDIYNNRKVLKDRLLSSPAIKSLTYHSGEPGGFHDATPVRVIGDQHQIRMRTCFADFDYFQTFQLELATGRIFNQQLSSDSTRAVMVNEQAVADLGFSPSEALGHELILSYFDSIPKQIIGVVKDYHFASLHSKIEPMVITPTTWGGNFAVKIDPDRISEAIATLEQNWNLLAPEFPFTYRFLDETLEQQYFNEQRQSRLFQLFAIVAILIAGLGMFGLASFTALTRSKEIGVRKILGSTELELLFLLSRDFLYLVLVAALIACPVAWYFVRSWLSDYAYHISMPIWVFIVVISISLLFAGLAIAYHCIKAARLNPVEVLKEID